MTWSEAVCRKTKVGFSTQSVRLHQSLILNEAIPEVGSGHPCTGRRGVGDVAETSYFPFAVSLRPRRCEHGPAALFDLTPAGSANCLPKKAIHASPALRDLSDPGTGWRSPSLAHAEFQNRLIRDLKYGVGL